MTTPDDWHAPRTGDAASVRRGGDLQRNAGWDAIIEGWEQITSDTFRVRPLPPRPVKPRVDPWLRHAIEVGFQLDALENDAVEVRLLASGNPKQTLIALRVEYVGELASSKAWVSLMATPTSLVHALRSAPTPFDSALLPPWRLPLAKPSIEGAPALLVWRCNEPPLGCGLLVGEILQEGLGVKEAPRVVVRPVEADGADLMRRYERATQLRRAGERQQRHLSVIGRCEKCGRDLRDPTYAAIGIGPECLKTYSVTQIRERLAMNKAVRSGGQVHPNFKRPESWLAQVKARWALS